MASPFARELTYFSATALVVSNMIGTVIFTSTGYLAADLGSPLLVVGIWLAGGLMALAGCLAYAELGVNLPFPAPGVSTSTCGKPGDPPGAS